MTAERTAAEALARGVLAGERRSLSRAITLLESESQDDQERADELLERLTPHSGGGVRIGFSGPPGAGKSTLIDSFGLLAISAGQRVAVLAVDPSSQKTGGSILGDKTRMARLAASEQSYIRPSPSRGERGGIAPRTREAILACEAAGYDLVLIETVGVGQGEVEIADLVDCLVVLLAAGAGDELQGMKRGLLEHGDVFAVGKADGEGRERAEQAAGELRSALSLVAGAHPPVLTLSAVQAAGVPELAAAVRAFVAVAQVSGRFEQRRQQQARVWFARAVERGLRQLLLSEPQLQQRESELAEAAARGQLPPERAARQLLALLEARLRNS